MTKLFKLFFAAVITAFILSCGSEDSLLNNNTVGDSDIPADGTSGAVIASIQVLTSNPQLDSSGSDPVTITAIIKDINNNLVEGETVSFSSNSGALEVTQALTESAGFATAILTTGGEFHNRTITVRASAGGLVGTVDVVVTGTTLTLDGEQNIVTGSETELTVFLKDSNGDGIANETISLTATNDLSPSSIDTDATGQAKITFTATTSGTDTITASALDDSVSDSLIVNISGDFFSFSTPSRNAEIDIGDIENVSVLWQQDGAAVSGQTIEFTTTRGNLSASSAITDGNGVATVTIVANNAGPAVITANAVDGPSTTRNIEFIAVTPDTVEIQPDPQSLGVGGETSTLTAVVRDAQNNLVKGQTVTFILDDITGGSIFPATATTDSQGKASTVYTSSDTPSAKNGISVTARVSGIADATTALTVAKREAFISIGTGNEIAELDEATYQKLYSVIVTDTNGNGMSGIDVQLSVVPRRFFTGTYILIDTNGEPELTIDQPFPNDRNENDDFGIPDFWQPYYHAACDNEDTNHNGILDPDEDDPTTSSNGSGNRNGQLDPGNKATVPNVVTTNESGYASFFMTFAQQYANWLEVTLEAKTEVSGTESQTSQILTLSAISSDIDDPAQSPPGQISPFTTTYDCSVDPRVP